ncbi:uncharacterized protein LOC129586377 [Paramacrobiotus metropolitanus]|uniref:uncharacterized protein LOC129586377 n=1 Tax=Paramacrobiotus metropolitanus TaxID=2943436 RepID=UPI0024465172|nr:uncharacterized protein LOC129586377 [Paramacrobiotus metropolitanus]
MFLRYIVRYMMNHPELVERLAQSRIIRSAARMSAGSFLKFKGASDDFMHYLYRTANQRLPQQLKRDNSTDSAARKSWNEQQAAESRPMDFSAKGDDLLQGNRSSFKDAPPPPKDHEVQRGLEDTIRKMREHMEQMKRQERG